MLLDVGCRYVILGHSERRHVMGESDELIHEKVGKAMDVGLLPIICIGEKLQQREAGRATDVVFGQIRSALGGVTAEQMADVTLAYEPVWAIGTGVSATPEQAEEMHGAIRGLVADIYGGEVASKVIIQYGGSVKAGNASELLGQENIDGALVGGAGLSAEAFVPIVQAAVALS